MFAQIHSRLLECSQILPLHTSLLALAQCPMLSGNGRRISTWKVSVRQRYLSKLTGSLNVPRKVELPTSLSMLLHSAITSASGLVASELHSMLDSDTLHLSLSRPLYLRTAQRARLTEAVYEVAKSFRL